MTQGPTGLEVETGDGGVLRGPLREGEGWYAGALRLLREDGRTSDVPDAVDLSGPVKRFASTREPWIGYRPMTRADLPTLVAWQAEPHAARWWDGAATTVEEAGRRYGGRIDGTDPTRLWVLEVGGRSVGWVQDYLVGDHPEYALRTGAPDAVGVDYAVGDPSWVRRGVGTRALWVFLRDVVRPHYPGAATYFAAPDHRNAVSLRVLDKLGFVRGLWFDEPRADGSTGTVVGCTFEVATVMG